MCYTMQVIVNRNIDIQLFFLISTVAKNLGFKIKFDDTYTGAARPLSKNDQNEICFSFSFLEMPKYVWQNSTLEPNYATMTKLIS